MIKQTQKYREKSPVIWDKLELFTFFNSTLPEGTQNIW